MDTQKLEDILDSVASVTTQGIIMLFDAAESNGTFTKDKAEEIVRQAIKKSCEVYVKGATEENEWLQPESEKEPLRVKDLIEILESQVHQDAVVVIRNNGYPFTYTKAKISCVEGDSSCYIRKGSRVQIDWLSEAEVKNDSLVERAFILSADVSKEEVKDQVRYKPRQLDYLDKLVTKPKPNKKS